MTFFDNCNNNIIKSCSFNEFNYRITYLDGTISEYVCYNKNHKKELEYKMLKQAIDRDKKIYNVIKEKTYKYSKKSIISFLIFLFSLKENLLLLCCISFIYTLVTIRNYLKNRKKLKELKKYKILIENYKEIKNNPSINKIIHFDTIYYSDIDIFSIDDYTLYDLNIIKKELMMKRIKVE